MKPIKDFPNYYITEAGVVFNSKDEVLSGCVDSYGYRVMKLRKDGKGYMRKLHRLVAEVYIPNPENKPTVNHKDGNKLNNHVSNLEWATWSEQIRYAKDTGLQCECPNRQAVSQVLNGKVVATYQSLRSAELETGIGWTGISAVLRGLRKTAGGYQWKPV